MHTYECLCAEEVSGPLHGLVPILSALIEVAGGSLLIANTSPLRRS